MRPTKIYLDLDDVLNTFTPYLLNFMCGNNVIDEKDYSKYPKEAAFDIVKAANILLKGVDNYYRKELFWLYVPERIWSDCPVTDFAEYLVGLSMNAVGQENVFVVTAPTNEPSCLSGKLKWIQNTLPKWLQDQYIITKHKYLFAKPDTLLVDDREENIYSFVLYKGRTITIPRPWNAFRNIITEEYTHIDYITEAFRRIFG
jgi:5'(3')-deoxyribonucleotidase